MFIVYTVTDVKYIVSYFIYLILKIYIDFVLTLLLVA